jgi:FdhD protein
MARRLPAIPVALVRCTRSDRAVVADEVVVEEPLEIRVGREPLVVLMRTPGGDDELAAGFLLSEGLLDNLDAVVAIDQCPHVSDEARGNVVTVLLEEGHRIAAPQRRFHAASSCGVCGKTSLEAITARVKPITSTLRVSSQLLCELPEKLVGAQPLFDRTGGVHAAGLFAAKGELLCAREDIGRHNAVDKVIGAMALGGRFPLSDLALVVSGRVSFEICQKAAVAGIGLVASISAPSSLAIELARRLNLTLVGFLRGRRFNIYAGADRIVRDEPPPAAALTHHAATGSEQAPQNIGARV